MTRSSTDFDLIRTVISFSMTGGKHVTAWDKRESPDVTRGIQTAITNGAPLLTYEGIGSKPSMIVSCDDIIAVKVQEYDPQLDRRSQQF